MRAFFVCLLALSLAAPVGAASWKSVAARVAAENKRTEQAIQETQSAIKQEQKALQSELAALKADVAEDEKALETYKQRFDQLLETEQSLRAAIEAEEAEINALAEIVRTAAKDAQQMAQNSLITPEYPQRGEKLAPLLDPARFPEMADIKNLVDILFTEMVQSRKIVQQSSLMVNARGKTDEAEILRAGKLSAYYRQGSDIGYLRPDPKGEQLVAIPGDLPGSVRQEIAEYLDGKGRTLPIDLSAGVIVEGMADHDGIAEWLEAGGFLVWPIVIIAAVAILLAMERLYCLGRIPTQTDRLMEQLKGLAEKQDWEKGRKLCEQNQRIPTCNVLRAELDHPGAKKEVLQNALEESILKELPRLERFLTTLSVLAAVAPLLGLLGTVTGMIHTFQGITVFGTSDPRMMSGGISEALITTQLGLAVAIPIMIAHHFFDRRVEKIVGDMEEKGTALITVLMRLGMRAKSPNPVETA